MGAKQRGQKRGAKKPQGSMKGSPMSQKQLSQSIQVPILDPAARGPALRGWQHFSNSGSPNHKGFSMSEEARNTERHVYGWGTTSLRNNAITFVSAGTLTREEPETTQVESTADISLPQEEVVETVRPESHKPEDDPTIDEEDIQIISKGHFLQQTTLSHEDVSGTVESQLDIQPSLTVVPPVTDFKPRERSVSLSSSASDEVVFIGRQQSPLPPARELDPLPSSAREDPTTKHTLAVRSIPASKSFESPVAASPDSTSNILPAKSVSARYIKPKKTTMTEEEAIMQDYIDNMVIDDDDDSEDSEGPSKPYKKTEHYRFHDGAGEEHVKVQIASSKKQAPQNSEITQAIDWDSDDLEDFDGISTSDEEIDEVSQVLRYRSRPSGAQYLVVAAGRGASDAKWILHQRLVSPSAVKEIEIYEEIKLMSFENEDDEDIESSDDDQEDEALDDLINTIESEDDENTRIMQYTSRMTDEQIALALAKQEELGMNCDELLLFNGDVMGEEIMDDDMFLGGDDFIPFSTKQRTSNRTRSNRNKKQRSTFPPAEAFADALEQDPYGAFDIMDFDRPSLRPKKKGRKSDFPFDLEVEDDDLRDQIMSTWSKDREKKAARKLERQEARMGAAMNASENGNPTVIKAEIRQFLIQEIEVLVLPPMESSIRASVHRLAKALHLTSRSQGKDGQGGGRYPVLTKTTRTPRYTMNNIWEVDDILNTRRFFPKHIFKSSKRDGGTASIRVRRGGGGVMSGATYMNGEIVGASAPEIGSENKGRAMLEKMGWTVGMGIGAAGNKGSIDPIKHVVKTTKAGLG